MRRPHLASIQLLLLTLLLSCLSSLQATVIEVERDGKIIEYQGYQNARGAWVFNAESDKKISMATLDWLPYIGENACGQGWVQQLVVGVFLQLDYQVHSYFVPWKRAVAMAERGSVDILYPEYAIAPNAPSDIFPDKNRDELLVLSEPFSGGNVALIKRKDHDFEFNGDLLSLKNQTIGVVSGYENSPEFDALMEEGYFHTSPAVDDWTNIKKLQKGRINFIVADPLVVNYSVAQNMSTDEAIAFKNSFDILEPFLAVQPLYLAFSKLRPEHLSNKKAFDKVLVSWRESGKLKALRDKWGSKASAGRLCNMN